MTDVSKLVKFSISDFPVFGNPRIIISTACVGHVTRLKTVRRHLSHRFDAQSMAASMFQRGSLTLRELQAIQVLSLSCIVRRHNLLDTSQEISRREHRLDVTPLGSARVRTLSGLNIGYVWVSVSFHIFALRLLLYSAVVVTSCGMLFREGGKCLQCGLSRNAIIYSWND